MEKRILLSKILAEAILLAKEGKLNESAIVLDKAEQLSDNEKTSNPADSQLIKFVREKYNLPRTHQFIEQSLEPINDRSQTIDEIQKITYAIGKRIEQDSYKSLSGVSVVSCCRNRSENLTQALKTWLFFEEIKEIIIIDWTSDRSLTNELIEYGFSDKRIRIVRVEDEPRWILSYAYNLGFRLARFDKVLKIDADITLKEDFFKKNILKDGCFIAGDWQKAEKGQEHINGFFYVKLKDLLRVKGFNEYITTYGWDDDDIYNRLTDIGLNRICVDTKSIYHIPHDDSSRLDGAKKDSTNAQTEFASDPLFKIRANRYLTLVMPPWNHERVFCPFEISRVEKQTIFVKRIISEMPHLVSEEIRNQAEFHAGLELISWRAGSTAYHLSKSSFEHLVRLKNLNEISGFDIDYINDSPENYLNIRNKSIVIYFLEKISFPTYKELINYFFDELKSLKNVTLFIYGLPAEDKEIILSMADKSAIKVILLKKWIGNSGLKKSIPTDLKDINNYMLNSSGFYIELKNDSIHLYSEIINNHSKLSQNHKAKIYIHAQHGLGNRLRAIGSASALAKATNRDLVIIWEPDYHCDCLFKDLFNYEGAVLDNLNFQSSNIKFYNYMESEPNSNKNEYIDTKIQSDIYVKSAFVLNHESSTWESENIFLREIKYSEAVNSIIHSFEIPSNSIGVHIRMEADKGKETPEYDSSKNWSQESHEQIQFWREKSHYSSFVKKINSLLSDKPDTRIFLATDLKENYDFFEKLYGSRLIYQKRNNYDRSKQQIIEALSDAILLSRCNHMLGSTWSSFSELAMRLSHGFNKVEMSGVDF